MKVPPDNVRRLILFFAFLAPISSASAGVLIDDHFDDEIVIGWESLGNSLGATHNITESETELTSEVIATEANLNTHRGIISSTAFDPKADPTGFEMTFEVSSQAVLQPGANGMFLGLTSSNSEFFRLTGVSSFGLTFWGQPARTNSDAGVSLVTDDIGNGGSAAEGLVIDSNPNTIDLSSFQDGFTATLTADSTGWAFTVDEVNDQAGTPTTIAKSGTWIDAGTDYATIFAAGSDWYVLASNQGQPPEDTHTVVYDRIALSTGSQGDNFRITSITPNLEGDDPSVTLEWNSIPDAEYGIDFSTDLSEGKWSEITDNAASGGDQSEFVHEFLPFFPELVGAERIFYRVRR